MAEVDNSMIKRGFWINHSEGTILGATFTTDQRIANIVIALVAIVVATAAGSAWNLVMFSWHQLRATSQPKDGLFRQQQILFRTLATPTSVLADTIKLLCVWRPSSWSSMVRCLPVISLSFVFAIASLAASISSSYIVNTTDLSVLVDGSKCREINMTAYALATTLTDAIFAAAVSLDTIIVSSARTYADQCYTPGTTPPRCHIYVQPRLSSTAAPASCPFDNSTCHVNGTVAMAFDTGYLDSNDDFGLNSPPTDRVQIRRVATCAPLDMLESLQLHDINETGLLANWTDARYNWPSEQLWIWHLGARHPPVFPNNGTISHSTVKSNTTTAFDT